MVATSLKDLRSSSLPFQHTFNLTDDKLIPNSARRMAPQHNDVVRKKNENMLKVRAILPDFSAWSFSVVIATKKDGKPRLYADHHSLNREIEADGFLLPRIQEMFDELKGGDVFLTVDVFELLADATCGGL